MRVRQIPGARWVPPENLHVTMKFLGHVPDERVPEVTEAVGLAAAGAGGGFAARLGATGAFPDARRARVVWVGLAAGTARLAACARALDEALAPLGFEAESRPFTAHITIARINPPRAVTFGADPEPVRFSVRALTLFHSRPGGRAPVYTALGRFPLGPR